MVAEAPPSSAIWSRRRDEITFDRLHKLDTLRVGTVTDNITAVAVLTDKSSDGDKPRFWRVFIVSWLEQPAAQLKDPIGLSRWDAWMHQAGAVTDDDTAVLTDHISEGDNPDSKE